jgi:aldose 1-epimerase
MEVVHLETANAHATVHPAHGGRIGGLIVNGRQMLVDSAANTLDWGCYPMVPFAGRVRDAHVAFRGESFEFPANDAPERSHALHGTLFDVAWTVVTATPTRVEMSCTLVAPWPWRGEVHHAVELSDTALTCTLSLTAHEDMPAMLGWHPWFVQPQNVSLPFASMLERGPDYLPTGKIVAPSLENADDCFVDSRGPLTLTYEDCALTLQSDCSHWVVYNQPTHAICVEPQSGPPNEVNDAPFVLPAGETMSRQFIISW